ncbi:protein GrpE [Firmicutes bacterium CAG:552]|nr:MAG: nucleotide exchange factor GrpE [Firmicutes bacterium CAG:552_39_19]CDB27136.1 protein GrpE [Firmicutes bacterium CAG:552]
MTDKEKQNKDVKGEGTRPETEEDTVRMFKDDFDAMQAEADQLATELGKAKESAAKEMQRADEMTVQCQRLQAEFENYRKRTNETNKRVRQDGAVDVLEKILPVLDAIEQAKKIITDQSVLSGVEMIERQLEALLDAYDVKRIQAQDAPFDPKFHNCVMEEEVDEARKGQVVRIFQQGYTIGDRVLRYATVIVGK